MASAFDFNDLHPKSVAASDFAQQQASPDTEDLFNRASQESGRPLRQMINEAKQGGKWPGKISLFEYVGWRLYELDKQERKAFLSDWLHWPIHDLCRDDEWSAKTVDKWECGQVLEQAAIPTIPVVAVVDSSGAAYGDTPTITTNDELRELWSAGTMPMFAKPNSLLGSLGALRIDEVDGDHVVVNGGQGRAPLATAIEEVFADLPYVIQPVVQNHGDIRAYAEGLATLRTVNFVTNGSVRMDRSVFKIPVSGNYADNNWRAGNLLADVNPVSGVIERVTRGIGPDMVEFTHHPDTDTPLLGTTLPGWADVQQLNEQTAQLFGAIKYQSLDIALTDAGPIVVEVNSGGSFALPQQASGRGMLTDENKSFFEACGVNFRKLSKRGND